jgi:hypothetical protein
LVSCRKDQVTASRFYFAAVSLELAALAANRRT